MHQFYICIKKNVIAKIVFKGLRLAKMTFLTKLSYFKLSIHQIWVYTK